MSTILTGGGALLSAGGALLTSDRKRAFGRSPAPGAVIHLDAPLVSDRRPFTIPGLPAADFLTIVSVVDKLPSAEDLYMLVAILTQGDSTRTWGGYTGRNYPVNAGPTFNTYIDGFLGAATADDPMMPDLTAFDNGVKRLFSMKLGHAGASFWLGGQLRANISYRNAQVSRPWSDTVYVGGEPSNAGFTWLGTTYNLEGYLGYSETDRIRTEQYMRELHPDVS